MSNVFAAWDKLEVKKRSRAHRLERVWCVKCSWSVVSSNRLFTCQGLKKNVAVVSVTLHIYCIFLTKMNRVI
jgi:hypothetical protein